MKTEDQGPLEGEPVAWRYRYHPRGSWHLALSPEGDPKDSTCEVEPLYDRAITEGGDPLSSKPLVPSDSSASGERPEAVIPEGWALVPREPTWQMWDQAENASMQCDWQTEAGVESKHGAYEFPTGRIWALVCGYRAMVEAAPPPPTASGLSATARSNEQRAIEELGGGGVPEPLTDLQRLRISGAVESAIGYVEQCLSILEPAVRERWDSYYAPRLRALGAVAPEKS